MIFFYSDIGAKLSDPRVPYFTIFIILLLPGKIQNKILEHIIFALRLNGQAVNS
jgi:hypothetical protein